MGKVDVSLEKEERKIACEISVSSATEYELGNIQKCIAAGYETVVVLSNDPKTLGKIQRKAETELEPATCERLRFLEWSRTSSSGSSTSWLRPKQGANCARLSREDELQTRR